MGYVKNSASFKCLETLKTEILNYILIRLNQARLNLITEGFFPQNKRIKYTSYEAVNME